MEDSSEVEIDTSGKKTAEDYKETEVEVEPEAEVEEVRKLKKSSTLRLSMIRQKLIGP